MFGKDTTISDLAEELLNVFTLDELLELNDLTEEFVVEFLIEGGHIAEPEHVIERFEEAGDE